MGAASPSTVNDLTALLDRLRAQEAALKEEYEGRLAALRQQITAVQLTLNLIAGAPLTGGPIRAPGAPATSWNWTRRLAGLTQPEALLRIAEENDGLLRVTEAKRILIAAGKVKGNPKNVGSHIYHLLGISGQWQKVAPGVFRLAPPGAAGEDEAAEEDKATEGPAKVAEAEDRPLALTFA